MSGTTSRTLAASALAAICLGQGPAFAQTPEQEKMWAEQRAQQQAEEKTKAQRLAKEREARRADPMAWVRTLDPMAAGGWLFRSVAADGSWAIYSTEHQMKRSGHLVTGWLRREFPEPQRSGGGDMTYSSDVEKVQYDCGKERSRVLLVIYYAENNLAGGQQTEEADPKQASWDPVVPGTQGEFMFHWACGAVSTGSRPR